MPYAVVDKTVRKWSCMHRVVLKYVAPFSSSLHLFRFFTLVFHLKQKHEEGQRLLQYLQQTNTALATGTFVCVINQDTLEMDWNISNPQFPLTISDVCRNVWVARDSKFVTGLGTVCNYVYILSRCYIFNVLHPEVVILVIIGIPFLFLRHRW